MTFVAQRTVLSGGEPERSGWFGPSVLVLRLNDGLVAGTPLQIPKHVELRMNFRTEGVVVGRPRRGIRSAEKVARVMVVVVEVGPIRRSGRRRNPQQQIIP